VEREEFAIYAASFQRLVGQLYAMTGDQCEAQDAVQEAFVRAWARRGKIDRNRAPEAWVRVTAWRIAASRWRRARDGTRLGSLAARPESTAGPTPDRVAFSDALRKVPADQRRALVLYHLCDLTVDQIAAARCRKRPHQSSPAYSPCEGSTAKLQQRARHRVRPAGIRVNTVTLVHRDPAGRSPDHRS
jgi:RNA polymerase sigma-70 factor (ECF subfamily)